MADSVLIVVPVLGRPHRVAPLIEDIEEATPEPHRILFVADAVGDQEEIEALEEAGAEYITVYDRRCYAAKCNAAYRASDEPLILTAADDLHFHPGWLPAATEKLSDQIHVVGTNDLGNQLTMSGTHSTHTLWTRWYIDNEGILDMVDGRVVDVPGFIYYEEYPHEYCDDESIGTAKARKRYAHAPDSIIEHMHHAWGKAENDATYLKARRIRHVGRRIYIRRRNMWRLYNAR